MAAAVLLVVTAAANSVEPTSVPVQCAQAATTDMGLTQVQPAVWLAAISNARPVLATTVPAPTA